MIFHDASPGDSLINQVLDDERFRQWRQLILIPSETAGVPDALGYLGTELGNIYSEGYPEPILAHHPRDLAADPVRFANWLTRLSDRRFYKGCVQTDRIELLAARFIAEAFAALPGSPPADDIFVNTQALSGAAANNAVYEAFVPHGGTVMGLSLTHGGHLTHGSEYNFSGKTYRIVHYGIDPKTRRLDYGAIRALALEHKPTMIIGGSSAYAWDFDWKALRAIADAVGATLLADVSHLAGPIVAGLLNNPLAHAHVVTSTTHKTLLGPRGAIILTTRKDDADRINSAIFPGLQGGPHMNSIAGIARLFELIVTHRGEFVDYQRRVLASTKRLADALTRKGFTLEYGGTDTHLLLVDLKPFATPGRADVPLDGEIAARLLEQVGIVCNKNTIPGDEDAGSSSGIRMGMPWLTERGITDAQIDELAGIVHSVLSQVHTTKVWVPGMQQRCRGRIDPKILANARQQTRALAEALPWPAKPQHAPADIAPPPAGKAAVFRLTGLKTASALQQLLTCNIADLAEGQARPGLLLNHNGSVLSRAVVACRGRQGSERVYDLAVHPDKAADIDVMLRAASDGYLLFDPADLYAKIDGPMLVEPVNGAPDAALEGHLPWLIEKGQPDRIDAVALMVSEPELFDVTKTFFIGQRALYQKANVPPKPDHEYHTAEAPLRRTVLNAEHKRLGAKLVPFAGWEMPVHYEAGIFAEHRAVRTAAGVFDVSHMGLIELAGPHALAFTEAVASNCATRLEPGQAEYNAILYPDGRMADDTFLYRMAEDRFILVVNAANAHRVWGWLNAVNAREICIDTAMPGKRVDGPITLRDLRDAGADSLVDLAVQGPLSLKLLASLAGGAGESAAIGRLRMNYFERVTLAGHPAIVARTGYTGEKAGFEIFVHPDNAPELWNALLAAGKEWGVLPAGLGARDSLRIEAGFPLFGHELEGPHGVSITEADYGFVAQFHVPFFVGRQPYIERNEIRKRRILRLKGSGRKSLRPGHCILDAEGRRVGEVTSFAFVDEAFNFVALALADAAFDPPGGAPVRGYRDSVASDSAEPDPKKDVPLTALTRFPEECEKDAWREAYAVAQREC